MQKDEILNRANFRRYAFALKAAVEASCQSQPFRTSAKSCQFLRHIVRLTLEGNVDELKERLIGIALLGREASYDTGSDAGVRVRANDVRKRLAAYYAASSGDRNLRLDIPAGSYVPRFFAMRSAAQADVSRILAIPRRLRLRVPSIADSLHAHTVPPVRELSPATAGGAHLSCSVSLRRLHSLAAHAGASLCDLLEHGVSGPSRAALCAPHPGRAESRT